MHRKNQRRLAPPNQTLERERGDLRFMKAAGCESVVLTEPELELYKIFADCTPLFNFVKSEMANLRDPKLEIVQEACRKGVPCETLVKATSPSDMQIVLWQAPAVAAVPVAAVAPVKQRHVRKAKKEFQLPPGWTVEVTVRTMGLSKGKQDKCYVAPRGRRYRSLAAVKRALKLI